MFNDLVSQQFPIPGMQSGQLDPLLNKTESSLSEAQRGAVVSASSDASLHQYVIPNKPMEFMESIAGGPLSPNLIISRMQMGQVDVKAGNFGQQQFKIPDDQFRGTGNMIRTADGMTSLPVKRKASGEPLHSFSQHSLMHNKRVAQMEHRPWLQQVSGITKRPLQVQNNAPAPTPMHSTVPNKRKVQMELHPVKAGHQRSTATKSQSALQNPISKIQNESYVTVRSKMRESLTAALALVSQQEDKSTSDEKSQPAEAENSATLKQENSILSNPAVGNLSGDSLKTSSAEIDFASLDNNGVEKMVNNSLKHVNVSDLEALRYNDQEFQSNDVLSYEDISFGDNFFIKDDLLQENGLSWVMDSRSIDQKLDLGAANQSQAVKAVQTPEALAFEIEEELFKLFGGVNKKYKEKGRSLLFNLKDRNNPELRERVMHGEISPERLCSMTAEELASKELSEWRMAKAEELAQMVVLPDSEVDIRRLVRKTHKGEFQVEVEHYDNSSADVSAGATSFSQGQHNKNETEGMSPDEPETIKDEQIISGQKNGADDKDYTFTIASNDGSDFMQGLIVDDGELLPPIVSLDEFMESLNSEPPFDILAENADKLLPVSEKGDPEVAPKSKTTVDTTKNATDVSIEKIKNDSAKADIDSSSIDIADTKSSDDKTDVTSDENEARLSSLDKNDSMKSSDSNAKSGTESQASTFRVEHLWEGILQLNISTMTSVVGTYISGERISSRDWPGILEIKGRVRLDAFEKFLHELPLSRSRAVMVLHLDLKDGRPESERASLQEVAESYVVDERVGIAEPGSGVEFYFCPPHRKILEMVGRILIKENDEALNAIDNGLIGVVVWRKTQLTSISPNSTSQHKRSSKKQHFSSSSRRTQEMNMKANNISPRQTTSRGFPVVNPPPEDDVDGDVPPGFGPSTTRDDDDLPEFNFSGAVNPSGFSAQNPSPRGLPRPSTFHPVSKTAPRPVEQMRELVHKYGQNLDNASTGNWQERSFAIQPWNDDDDDDIPEWQPQAPQHQISQPVRGLQQPTLRRHYMVNQQHTGQASQMPVPQTMAMQSMQAHSNVNQQGTWWVPQPGQGNNIQNSNLGSQGSGGIGGQFYGTFGRAPTLHPNNNNRGF